MATQTLGARLGKVYEYLFKDYGFLSNFTSSLDYESYWQKRRETEEVAMKASSESLESYRFNLIANLIEPQSRVLDIGCGDGSLLSYLKKAKSITPFGIETSPTACKIARTKGIEVLEADITKDDFALPEIFDYIIMSEVLEHLSNPIEVLERVKSHFNCRLLIEIPNTGAINDRLRLLFGRFPKQWILHPSEHLHFWTVTDFSFLCHHLGFTLERYYGLHDAYYDLGPLKLWKWYPKLFTRYVLYVLK